MKAPVPKQKALCFYPPAISYANGTCRLMPTPPQGMAADNSWLWVFVNADPLSLTSTCFHFKTSSRFILGDEPYSTSDLSSSHALNSFHMSNHVLPPRAPCHPPCRSAVKTRRSIRCSAQSPLHLGWTAPFDSHPLLLPLTFRWAWSLMR